MIGINSDKNAYRRERRIYVGKLIIYIPIILTKSSQHGIGITFVKVVRLCTSIANAKTALVMAKKILIVP